MVIKKSSDIDEVPRETIKSHRPQVLESMHYQAEDTRSLSGMNVKVGYNPVWGLPVFCPV